MPASLVQKSRGEGDSEDAERADVHAGSGVLLSMTCFLDFDGEDKWARVRAAVESLVRTHGEHVKTAWTWLLVNEFSDAPKRGAWASDVHREFPFVHFVQKDASRRGQAASLNLILRELRAPTLVRALEYGYWVHWEESWVASRECVSRAIAVLQTEPSVSRVQLTRCDFADDYRSQSRRGDRARDGNNAVRSGAADAHTNEADWLDPMHAALHGKPTRRSLVMPPRHRPFVDVSRRAGGAAASTGLSTDRGDAANGGGVGGAALFRTVVEKNEDWGAPPAGELVRYTIIAPAPRGGLSTLLRNAGILWPVYSLRPTVMLPSAFREEVVGWFDEDPRAWPWRFEHSFGERWERAGGVAAVLDDAPVVRGAGHHSIAVSRTMTHGGINYRTAFETEARRALLVLGLLAALALVWIAWRRWGGRRK